MRATSPTCSADKHGTLNAYRHGCRCPEARAEHAEANARVRRRSQARTHHAVSYGAPWTAQDEWELEHGEGTLVERALRLGRTYMAAHSRLNAIRARLAQHASTVHDATMTHRPQEDDTA